jgi:hypothetical protein
MEFRASAIAPLLSSISQRINKSLLALAATTSSALRAVKELNHFDNEYI